jgi:hypothetical protein
LTAGEAVLKQAFLVDVTVGVDRVWQVALSVLDQIASTHSGQHGEYVLLGDFDDVVGSWRGGCADVLGDRPVAGI